MIENSASNKLAVPESYQTPSDALVLKSAFSLPTQVFHLTCLGDKLVTAGPDGTAHLFKLDSSELGLKGKGLSHVHEYTIGDVWNPKNSALSPPGVMIQTHRLNHVELEPASSSALSGIAGSRTSFGAGNTVRRLMAIQSKKLFLYDLPTSKTVNVYQPASEHLNTTSFSPHAPCGALVATGGFDRTLYIIDTRMQPKSESNGIAWKFPKAHSSSILDIKFNSFIPYWVATSSEDGTVNVWDIRFASGPAARIDAHFDAVNSIVWSNTHCDIISTGSTDRAWRAWSIKAKNFTQKTPSDNFMIGLPDFETNLLQQPLESLALGAKLIGEYQSDGLAPIISVCTSTQQADTFISLSASGELVSHTIRNELFEQLADHRYESHQTPYDIETKVYTRNMSEAYSTLIKYTRRERSHGQLVSKHERELLKLLVPQLEIQETEWSIDSVDKGDYRAMMVAFLTDLEKFAYGLPPRFGLFPQCTSMIDPNVAHQCNLVNLRFNILDQVFLQGNWNSIVESEKAIYSGMESDPEFMDQETLKLLVEEVITHNYLKGMSMGLRFGEIVADTPKSNFERLSELMGLLLFPTVYESMEWLPQPEVILHKEKIDDRQAKIVEYLAKLKRMRGHNIDEMMNLVPVSPVKLSPSRARMLDMRSRSRPMIFTTTSGLVPTSPSAAPSPLSATGNARRGSRNNLAVDPFGDMVNKKQSQLSKTASESKSVLPMVSIEIRILKLVEKGGDKIEEDIIAIMQDVLTDAGGGTTRRMMVNNAGNTNGPQVVLFEKTLSAKTNKMYLDALLAAKRFEEYFGSAFELVVAYAGLDFARLVFNSMEIDGILKFKEYTDSLFQSATTQLQPFFQQVAAMTSNNTSASVITTSIVSTTSNGSTTNNPPSAPAQGPLNPAQVVQLSKALIQSSKLVRDGLTSLIRISAYFMQGLETLKQHQAFVDSMMKLMTQFTATMLQLTSLLLRSFETFDKLFGKGHIATKEWAQTVHDGLRDAARALPLSQGKNKPTQAAEKAAMGFVIHEEVFNTLDKLYRGYITVPEKK